MQDVNISSTTVTAFTPRTQVSSLNIPFNWTVNKLRAVEQLSADWKARNTADSQVTWKTLAKDVANVILGTIAALALTVFTLGIGGVLLLREYIIQKENDVYAQAKKEKNQELYIQELCHIIKLLKDWRCEENSEHKALQRDFQALEQKFASVNEQIDSYEAGKDLNRMQIEELRRQNESATIEIAELKQVKVKLMESVEDQTKK